MRRRIICLCMAAALCLSVAAGCKAAERPEEDGFRLWAAGDLTHWSESTTALGSWEYQGAQTVPEVMAALLAGPPADSGLISAVPQGTELLDWSLEDGVLSVDLSRPYGGLVGVDLTLADYCVALTLTQLKGIEGVRITVNGRELPYRDRQVFYAKDIVLSGAEEEPVELSAALYFRRAGSGELGYELRVFRLTENEDPAMVVLQALLAGPEDAGRSPLRPVERAVNNLRLEDGVCHVDLSAALLDSVPADEAEQRLTLASLVNTLCSLDNVEAVQLLVDGEILERYGAVDTSQPLREEN